MLDNDGSITANTVPFITLKHSIRTGSRDTQ